MKFKEPHSQASKFEPIFEPILHGSSYETITALSWNDKKSKLLAAGKLSNKNTNSSKFGFSLLDINYGIRADGSRPRDATRPISIDHTQDSIKSALWVNANEFCISLSGNGIYGC